jgi:hypothetical protein
MGRDTFHSWHSDNDRSDNEKYDDEMAMERPTRIGITTQLHEVHDYNDYMITMTMMYHDSLFINCITERRCQVVSTLLRIREVPRSNFGSETDYPEVFHAFAQSLQENPWTVP